MNKPHKHAELIKAWADGAEIEAFCESIREWEYHPTPTWNPLTVYRIKPKVKWEKKNL